MLPGIQIILLLLTYNLQLLCLGQEHYTEDQLTSCCSSSAEKVIYQQKNIT
jgi:hypothetical protein